MGKIFDRFEYRIDSVKMDDVSWMIFIGAWLVVVACSLGSVYAHHNRFTKRQRRMWVAIILGLPLIGVLLYLPSSIIRDGYNILKSTKKDGKSRGDSNRIAS